MNTQMEVHAWQSPEGSRQDQRTLLPVLCSSLANGRICPCGSPRSVTSGFLRRLHDTDMID